MSENRTPKPGDLFRHFKGNLYQIVTVAIHTETEEALVIYQALYGDFRTYARPLSMFLEEVDRIKYPEVTQTYRFEKIDRETLCNCKNSHSRDNNGFNAIGNKINFIMEEVEHLSRENGNETREVSNDTGEVNHNNSEYGLVNQDLLLFLDADTYSEKLEILYSIRNKIDERLITDIEMSLDLFGHEGTLEDRFLLVKNNLETLAKFESKRLR